MKVDIHVPVSAALVTLSATGMASAQERLSTPYRMQEFAALGWTVMDHLGQSKGQERMLVQDANGQDRIAVLHTDLGLLTYEAFPEQVMH